MCIYEFDGNCLKAFADLCESNCSQSKSDCDCLETGCLSNLLKSGNHRYLQWIEESLFLTTFFAWQNLRQRNKVHEDKNYNENSTKCQQTGEKSRCTSHLMSRKIRCFINRKNKPLHFIFHSTLKSALDLVCYNLILSWLKWKEFRFLNSD